MIDRHRGRPGPESPPPGRAVCDNMPRAYGAAIRATPLVFVGNKESRWLAELSTSNIVRILLALLLLRGSIDRATLDEVSLRGRHFDWVRRRRLLFPWSWVSKLQTATP
jgi:hypothetical protein